MAPERENLTDSDILNDICALSARWGVDALVMRKVWLAAQEFEVEMGGSSVAIISGWRSQSQQRELARRGRPTAADDRSTHRSCPATGVDVSLGFIPSNFLKARWGLFTFKQGLRWGGGGPVDPDTGIPLDWQHVDIGPRK